MDLVVLRASVPEPKTVTWIEESRDSVSPSSLLAPSWAPTCEPLQPSSCCPWAMTCIRRSLHLHMLSEAAMARYAQCTA